LIEHLVTSGAFSLDGGTWDTLFQGGPGATGRSFSDFPAILASIEGRLLSLPPETAVRTGHGAATTIGAESPQLAD
jgi:glyoxylase-like metal-dependent hydrolase (beta-lactamase superfamily II)